MLNEQFFYLHQIIAPVVNKNLNKTVSMPHLFPGLTTQLYQSHLHYKITIHTKALYFVAAYTVAHSMKRGHTLSSY